MDPHDRHQSAAGTRNAVACLEVAAARLLDVEDVCFAPIGQVPAEALTDGVLHRGEVCAVDSVGGDGAAYLGVPVLGEDGRVIGALRAVAHRRVWTEADIRVLRDMSVATGHVVGLLRTNRALAGDLMMQSAQEDRLRESQQRVLATFDGAPVAQAVIGLDGSWLEVNSALCRLLGRSSEELAKRTFGELTHPEDRTKHLVPMCDLIDGRIPHYGLEKRYIRRDGEVVWAAEHLSVVRDRAGAPVCFIAQIEDVTERRRRSEQLQRTTADLRTANEALTASAYQALASEARYRATFEGAPVGIAEVTLDGTVSRVNSAMCALADRGADELEGTALATLLHPDDRPGLAGKMPAGRTGPLSPTPGERRIVRPGGGLRWVNVHQSLLCDVTGAVSHRLVHFADVTEDHDNRDRLEASRARFATLVEHSSDVIAIFDADFSLSYVSPASQVVFGLDPGPMVGSSMLAGMHPDDAARFAERCRHVMTRARDVMTLDVRIHHRDGSWRTIESTVSNHLDDSAVLGLVCNCRDVSDRVEIARRLAHQAMHDHLTGLPNRALILDRLDQAMARADLTGHPCAVLYIDLDRFKEVNDDLGHQGGDQLLMAVAERLQNSVRPGDSVGRIGGDEFVLLADGISNIDIALDIAERVRHAIAQPVVLDGEVVTVGCSVGIALSGDHQADLLLREADVALYRAKANGRNRWELYEQAGPVLELGASGPDPHAESERPTRRRRRRVPD